jgi:hypothetical protein
MSNRTRRRQHGGNLPFFDKPMTSWFSSEQGKVNEKAELDKEIGHLTSGMDRLKRKLEAYERKMTYFEKQLSYYQDLATNALKMHEIYENGLAALRGEQHEEEDEEEDDEEPYEEDLPEDESAGASIEDSAVEEK